MSMRKWKRGVAKYRMELCGVDKPCSKERDMKKRKTERERSYFARTWREYLTPKTKEWNRYIRTARRKGTA